MSTLTIKERFNLEYIIFLSVRKGQNTFQQGVDIFKKTQNLIEIRLVYNYMHD